MYFLILFIIIYIVFLICNTGIAIFNVALFELLAELIGEIEDGSHIKIKRMQTFFRNLTPIENIKTSKELMDMIYNFYEGE